MTNKTVTMPLELAERLQTALLMSHCPEQFLLNELRALLAAPPLSDYLASCKSAHNGLTIDQAEAVEKGIDDLLFGAKPAVERQEPVAWLDHESGALATVALKSVLGGGFDIPLYTSPPVPVAVPDGWKLVPIEPTELMIRRGDQNYSWSVAKIYKAMIEDAPACLDKVKELNQ